MKTSIASDLQLVVPLFLFFGFPMCLLGFSYLAMASLACAFVLCSSVCEVWNTCSKFPTVSHRFSAFFSRWLFSDFYCSVLCFLCLPSFILFSCCSVTLDFTRLSIVVHVFPLFFAIILHFSFLFSHVSLRLSDFPWTSFASHDFRLCFYGPPRSLRGHS